MSYCDSCAKYEKEIAQLEAEIERLKKQRDGYDWCESCGKELDLSRPEGHHLTLDGVWLCDSCWGEL